MYISVGVNLSISEIPQKEGIIDYGLFRMKKLFQRGRKKAPISGENSPRNAQILDPRFRAQNAGFPGFPEILEIGRIHQILQKTSVLDVFYSFSYRNGPISMYTHTLTPSLTATPHYIPSERLPHT